MSNIFQLKANNILVKLLQKVKGKLPPIAPSLGLRIPWWGGRCGRI